MRMCSTVIIFGNSVYADYQQCSRVSSYHELTLAIKNIISSRKKQPKSGNNFYDYMYKTILMSHKNTHNLFSYNALKWVLKKINSNE